MRERYDVFSRESLYQAIQNGEVTVHPAWEDYMTGLCPIAPFSNSW